MTRRKSVCLNWTLVLFVVLVCPSVYTRPQEAPAITTNSEYDETSTQPQIRYVSTKPDSPSTEQSVQLNSPTPESSARNVKSKTPIRESIEMVAIQLLDKPNSTLDTPIISDTRMPPKLKTQVKHKVKTRNEDVEQFENAHRGEAVPVTIEELDTEKKLIESATSSGGISTWSSLSSPAKDNSPTEPTKLDEKEKKPKPIKNKPKRPATNKISKRPIIGSLNKSDLVAGGSAINENVYNKIKDTVLANVQKNKNTSARPSTTTSTSTEVTVTKKETKPTLAPSVAVTNKTKKKNKNKHKILITTLSPPVVDDSALLPTEAKEQEIELEVSTPATTTKKPKRKSNKKKNKTKKRKTTTSKPNTDVTTADVKTPNKTKTNKNTKKPIPQTGAITTQIYNYLSREVMPSVGVGVLGLASLVGIAGYFLYPFAAPVRRTFEVDKSDDIYRNNAEEYAVDGNGQAEEEMLGTVLAGMPAHAKQKLNPYAAQTAHINRYPIKKEQDIRYRYVTPSYNPNYKVHYAQQKTGIAHAAVYSKPLTYGPYETRQAFKTEDKFNYEKPNQPNYTPYSAAPVEPIYATSQTGPSGGGEVSSFESNAPNSGVVYGVKPSSESDFKPVYPFENQYMSETTSSSVTYPPTSMYLDLNDHEDNQEEAKYGENLNNSEGSENQFVVGNVPKELSDSATPAVVPEHGPRKLRKKRGVVDSLEEYLSDHNLDKEVFISNEIDDFYSSSYNPIRNFDALSPNENVFPPVEIVVESKLPETSKDFIIDESKNSTKYNHVRSIIESSKVASTKQDNNNNTPENTDKDNNTTASTNTHQDNNNTTPTNTAQDTKNTASTNINQNNINNTPSTNTDPDCKDVDSINRDQNFKNTASTDTDKVEIIESVSTVPISSTDSETETTETTQGPLYDDLDTTTESINFDEETSSTTPNYRHINCLPALKTTQKCGEAATVITTTPKVLKTTTKKPKIKTPVIILNTSLRPKYNPQDFIPEATTEEPESITYPPVNGLYSWLQKVLVFKLKLGLGLIQGTMDVLDKLKTDTTKTLNSV